MRLPRCLIDSFYHIAKIYLRGVGCQRRYLPLTAEKFSLGAIHMGAAFGVLYCATGPAAIGGLAAVLEPVRSISAT